jgi:ATP-binding cassette subfamily A (ABC1) protein 3
LTAQEHLEFFYDLKGADPDPVKKKADIEKLMLDVGVNDKKNSLASHLSGGNKRKLSVAIALCGGSKFVLLDEPTSGMDLQARRQLWNMLKECKKDRIVVLTTHYMDEADILGDRIGIMANGKLTCLGTSMFLKNKFGVGYNLTLVKSSTEPNTNIMEYMNENLGPNVKK